MKTISVLVICFIFSINSFSQSDSLRKSFYKQRMDFALDNDLPLVMLEAVLGPDEFSNSVITVWVFNRSDKVIDAYIIEVNCFNRFGDPINGKGNNVFTGITQEIIKPLESKSNEWKLRLFPGTTKAKVFIKKIHFNDNSVFEYNPKIHPFIDVEDKF